MKIKPIFLKGEPDNRIIGYQFICPGCGHTHEIPIELGTWMSRASWTYNNNREQPTFSPSLHIRTGKYANPNFVEDADCPGTVCHSFIIDGKIQYLSDCTHSLAGQTIELPEIT